MIPFNEMTPEQKKKLGASLMNQLTSAQAAGQGKGIEYDRILQEAAQYSVSRHDPMPGGYSDYLDKSVERSSRVRTSLLCGQDPRPAVLPNTRYDLTLAKVIRKLDDHYWEKKRISLKWQLMIGSMVDYGTAGLIPLMTKGADGQYDVDVIGVSLKELVFGDWTQWDVSLQPFWARIIVMRLDKAKKRWPEYADKITPSAQDNGDVGGMSKVWADFWSASGSAEVKNPLISKDAAEKEWLSGNCIVYEYWTKDVDDNVVLAYIVNNCLVQHEVTDYPDYPLCLFRNYMKDGFVLGKSQTEIAKHLSDARTEIMQFMLLQNSAFAKRITEYNKQSGMTKADVDSILNDNAPVVGTDAEFFGNSIKIHEGANQLNQSQAQLYNLLGDLGDQETQTTQWLEGTVPANSGTPAAQTQFMTQAGMQPIKWQATLMQLDGLYRFEWMMIWHYQEHLTAEMQIRIVGEEDEDGNPRFITLNHDVDKKDLEAAVALATKAIESGSEEVIELGENEYEPQDILLQYAMIKKRVKDYNRIDTVRLNDIQAARVDIAVGEGMLALEQEQNARVIMTLDAVGLALPEEPRRLLAKLPTDPNTIAKLPRMQQIDILNQQKQILEQQQAILQQQAQIAQQQAPQDPGMVGQPAGMPQQ